MRSVRELRELQRVMAGALFRPLTRDVGMQKRWTDGRPMETLAAEFIKPNDRLTSFERLEIYNRVYWFRLLDCFYDDYPGLRAVLGERKFTKLAEEYLARFPSASFSLRNLGSRLEKFLLAEPALTAPRTDIAIDMARFEWAQVVAFDSEARPPLTTDDLLDTEPTQLRFGLQPYLSLLALRYPVDDFVLALKESDTALRGEASNTLTSAPKTSARKKRLPLPAREPVFVAVHRQQNMLYYKRLEPEAYAILRALGRGATLQKACVAALTDSRRTDVDWPAQIRAWFDTWSALGWFCRPAATGSRRRVKTEALS